MNTGSGADRVTWNENGRAGAVSKKGRSGDWWGALRTHSEDIISPDSASVFFKSSLAISLFRCDWPDSVWSITYRCIAWMAASEVTWMPIPICVGESYRACDGATAAEPTFDNRRRNTFPTEMGLIPSPSFEEVWGTLKITAFWHGLLHLH